MSITVDQKSYLQKYLCGASKEKKKKKKKLVTGKGFKIIDDDLDLSKLRPLDGDELDILDEGEDAPQIAGIIDERPEDVKKLEQFKTTSKWKVVNQDDGFTSNLQVEEIKHDIKEQEKENAIIFGKMYSDSEDERKGDDDSDQSPPRKSSKSKNLKSPLKANSESDSSPLRKRDKTSSKSPVRKRKADNDSDLSPPRKNEDLSRRKKISRWGDFEKEKQLVASQKERIQSNSSDMSPSRNVNRKQNTDSDQSPPRNSRRDHKKNMRGENFKSTTDVYRSNDSDTSPLRKIRHSTHSDSRKSPSKQKSQLTADKYFQIKNRSPDESRHRKFNSSISPSRKQCSSPKGDYSKSKSNDSRKPEMQEKNRRHNNSKQERRRNYESDSDQSPPRRESSARRNKHDDSDPSPPRKKDKRRNNSSSPPPTNRKRAKTLEGKRAGLQDARQLREENEQFRRKEDEVFNKMADDVSGRNAKAVSRRSKRETSEERRKLKEKTEKQKHLDAKYQKWSKGLKQVEAQEARVQDFLHEASKPLARLRDDKDLERSLKEIEREGDPMLKYIRQRKRENGELPPEKPSYKGSFPPNRFNIRPGYRWDGVDRSNGYEKKYFDQQSKRKAREEEEYKWSTEDL